MKWNLETLQIEALKYNSRMEFKNNKGGAYSTAVRLKLLDIICGHMIEIRKPKGYWTKEKYIEEALKYKTKTDFWKNSGRAYNVAIELNILDEICSHMELTGNLYKRCIYVYEFPDNSAYIGLTFNIKDRQRDHARKGTIYKYKKKTNLIPEFKQLTEYIEVEEAQKLEGKYVDEYRKNGWNILNEVKTGGLGGSEIIWNIEKCKEEALKYTKKRDFKTKSAGAYNAARKLKILDEICEHMIKMMHTYTLQECIDDAKKYNKEKDWKKNSKLYGYATNHKWLKECTSHMIKRKNWKNIEDIKKEAKKYKTKTEFRKNCSRAYLIAIKLKILDEICEHMIKIDNSHTLQDCIDDAKKYTTIKDWEQNSKLYGYAQKHKWLEECTKHMMKLSNTHTLQDCIKEAKKYNNLTDWRINSKLYRYTAKHKWLEECKKYIIRNIKVKNLLIIS